MNTLLYTQNYLSILIFALLSITLATILIFLPFAVSRFNPSQDKLSSYECGFKNFGNTRKKFDIRFYLVSILFIIFDLEIVFLFPWSIMLKKIGLIGFTSVLLFIITLGIGFIYELKKGALEWE